MAWIDLHIDSLRRAVEPGVDLLAGSARAQADLPRLRAAGARGAIWAACDDVYLEGPESLAFVLRMLAAGRDLVERAGGELLLVRSRADWERCRAGGPVGMILAVEGAHSLLGCVEGLAALHALGVRVLTLTWNQANPFASGCGATPGEDRGLTPLGAELLVRARELGLWIDLAHASPRTLADAMALLPPPILVSHAGCAALRPHRRNLTDDQLRALAAAGGLVGITIYPPFLVAEGGATVATVAAHVAHAARVAGPGAVAMGTDLDGITLLPTDVRGLEGLDRLRGALAAAGLAEEEIEGVMWRNAARAIAAALPEG
ncbi:MAG: membrane dipeptidase [Candidatus Eisenbacteria bacterium]|uniref:Membrane dipeptidase n=1 Tax=Eiseniibacteriota bacterium TaxID=2212470 RepID=A0A938BN98_UNCEI|nr:membrane dipeptidase [Candidatus Eisenbacteria bacterium]